MEIKPGQSATVLRTVGQADTAAAVGSGDLAVLGTPVLLAWLEAATIAVCGSTEFETTVGTRVAVDHLRPSAVGTEVYCTATVAHIDGRMVTFKVEATQKQRDEDVLVGRGVVTRAVVQREQFLARLDRRATDRS
ncbi:MAG TPA: hotdog domain-containing protein [Actinomycetota bacterium]|nr:hotdog domain-containing protein [Actinomycetota bacterium]